MHLKIKILNEKVRPFYENHDHFHEGDSGLDLFVAEDETIHAGRVHLIGLGIAVEASLDKLWDSPTSFPMYPRSSICKTPLRMANCVGIIDAGYRGQLMLPVDCVFNTSYMVKSGDRLVQICAPDLGGITFEIVDELSNTSRGEGGIGSTGT